MSGHVFRAVYGRKEIVAHPDTDSPISEFVVPMWPEILEAARACAKPSGLGYLGADIIVDAERGPCVIEVNAFPGLEIQNVCGAGLRNRVNRAREERRESFSHGTPAPVVEPQEAGTVH